MKGIRNILLLLMFSLLLSGIAFYDARPDGRTTESREEILNNIDEKTVWEIRTEISIAETIVCSIYSEDKYGIIVFREQDNGKYKWQQRSSMRREAGYPLFTSIIADVEVYNFFMLNRDEAVTLEVIYTEHGSGKQKSYRFDVTETDLVYTPAVFNSCHVEYNYYDAEGNALFD